MRRFGERLELNDVVGDVARCFGGRLYRFARPSAFAVRIASDARDFAPGPPRTATDAGLTSARRASDIDLRQPLAGS
jgi:hypothetical protein